jgi:CBS domain-containing protein
VSEIMTREPITVTPETPTVEAIAVMRKHGIAVLPVVREGRLVGVVTESDFMGIASVLLEQKLRE